MKMLEVNAVSRLKQSPDFKLFRDYIALALDDQDVINRSLQRDQVQVGQGKAIALAELLRQIDDSERILDRSR